MTPQEIQEYIKALMEAERRYVDVRFDELEKSIDRRFGAQYSISGRLLGVIMGISAVVAIIAAIVKWHL